jgi:hypothetical protein
MGKNRKVSKKMSVHATNTMRFGAIIAFLGVTIILNVLSSSSCDQLMNEKGGKERELERLKDEYRRASTRWEEMKTPERIEKALVSHGLRMATPRADQCIRLKENGTPYPNQLSLTRLRQRSSVGSTARYETSAPRRAAPARGRTR